MLTVVVCTFSQASLATKPCQPLDEKTFNATTVKPAELIILGKLENSLPFAPLRKQDYWTDLQIIKILKGTYAHSSIRVEGDLLFDIYGYKKGDLVILFLKKTADAKWQITNLNWMDCIPGMLAVRNNKVSIMVRDVNTMPLSEFERYVTP